MFIGKFMREVMIGERRVFGICIFFVLVILVVFFEYFGGFLGFFFNWELFCFVFILFVFVLSLGVFLEGFR